MDPTDTKVIAVRFASMASTRSEQLYRYSEYRSPDGPMDLDYFFWAIQRGDETILVDTGFHPDMLVDRPGRVLEIPPMEAMGALGIDRDRVSRIIVSHFHYDHIGNLSSFPNARLTLQRDEFEFWTGPHRYRPAAAASVEATEIDFIAAAHRAGRVDLVDGNVQFDDEISLQRVGGHCPGQQIVKIGDPGIVLCSDALHFREEMVNYTPFNVFFDLEETFLTYDLLNELEQAGATIVPGHDPAVMTSFEALPNAEGLAVSLQAPTGEPQK